MDTRVIGAALLTAVPLAIVGGLVYATAQPQPQTQQVTGKGYICPINGEELPCQNCCPLSAQK